MLHRSVILLIFTAAPLPAGILFADNFDHSGALHSGALHGATPDTRPGSETWIASGQFAAAGSVTATPTSGGSATLAFNPVNGRTYTLDARFSATAAAGNNDWLALGFASGRSTVAGANDRFINANVTGKAWMLLRGSATPASPNNGTHLGNGTTGGTASSTNWVNWTGGTSGTIDLRVVLDTTGGTGTWTATWYAKRPADPAYATVRPTATLLDESINSVGFAKSNTAVTGTLLNFSLSATGDGPPPPPPSDDALVSIIPVTDGNPATAENGYAINSVAFAQNNLIAVGDRQIIACYRRHASDAAHPANNTIIIGRRGTAASQWELFPTSFLSFNIDDTHNVISCAIDGDGFLHMSWGMRSPLLATTASCRSGRRGTWSGDRANPRRARGMP